MSKEFFEGDLYAKPIWIMRRPAFIAGLASFLASLEMSGDNTVNWVLDELYFHHKGTLYDYRRKPIDLEVTYVDQEFGEEPRRWINALKESAGRLPKQRLQMRCVPRVMYVDLARMSYSGRMGVEPH